MTRMFGWLRRIGLDDIALGAGVVLLWIGCSMIARPLPYLVIGSLAIAYWAGPLLLSLRRRR